MILTKVSAKPRLLLLQLLAVESSRSIGSNSDVFSPDVILSAANRKACIQRLKRFKSPKKDKDDVNRKAAVLVPLCLHKGAISLLYTLRSSKVSLNRGQVSFPGGMRDDTDDSYEETALRETWEELRIPKENVDVWGSGNVLERRNISVMPVVGYLGQMDPDKVDFNKEEVEEVFVLSLEELCDPARNRYTQFRDSYTLPTFLGSKHRIWGLTAIVTHILLKSLVPQAYKHELKYIHSINPTKKVKPILL